MNLQLHCRPARKAVVVYGTGRITFGEEATLLFNQIGALLAKKRRVLLHLGGVEAMDAAGLGTLAELAARASTSGGEIKFCNLPGHIAILLDLTHLSQMLKVYETEEEALVGSGEDFPGNCSGVPAVA
ncbi:MAG: STAS domain-containing protein [Terriglobales bacterium]|jgi:anti-anti-sigma factor